MHTFRLSTVFLLLCMSLGSADAEFKLTNFQYEKLRLPPALLDRIVKGVEFAFETGAAREIGYEDLGHAHLLYNREHFPRLLAQPDAILLHTQEMAYYGRRYFERRNIILRLAAMPNVLDCALGQHLRNFGSKSTTFCTVDNSDLEMDDPTTILFMPVDKISSQHLIEYGENVRKIRGHKVLFYISGYDPGWYADR